MFCDKKYLNLIIIILYLSSFSKEKKDLCIEKWTEIKANHYKLKTIGNVKNFPSQKSSNSFEFGKAYNSNKIEGAIISSYNFSKKNGFQISFSPKIISEYIPLGNIQPEIFEILLISTSIENLNKENINDVFEKEKMNNIKFIFNIINNKLRKNDIIINLSVYKNINGIKNKILSKIKNISNITISDFINSKITFLIEIINKELLIKTNEGNILFYKDELIELEDLIDEEQVYLCLFSYMKKKLFIKNLKISKIRQKYNLSLKENTNLIPKFGQYKLINLYLSFNSFCNKKLKIYKQNKNLFKLKINGKEMEPNSLTYNKKNNELEINLEINKEGNYTALVKYKNNYSSIAKFIIKPNNFYNLKNYDKSNFSLSYNSIYKNDKNFIYIRLRINNNYIPVKILKSYNCYFGESYLLKGETKYNLTQFYEDDYILLYSEILKNKFQKEKNVFIPIVICDELPKITFICQNNTFSQENLCKISNNDNYKEISYKLRKLQLSNSITIIINGPKDDVNIISSEFSRKPDHVYVEDSEDLGQKDSVSLTKEGPNTIILSWDSKLQNCIKMFKNCIDIISVDLTNFDSSSISSSSNMFYNGISLKSIDFSNFDTSKISSMVSMFENCSSLSSLDLTKFDTSSSKTMNSMFKNCQSLKSLDLSSFSTSKVSSMQSMFYGCNSLTSLNLSNFYTPALTNMKTMFSGCKSLAYLELLNFNTTSIKIMDNLFTNCLSLISLNLSNFDMSSVKSMVSMFSNCTSLRNIYFSEYRTKSVENTGSMFLSCKSLLSLNLSSFDTSLVTNMNSMFKECSSLTSLDLSSFNVSLVNNMQFMFLGCSSIESLNLSNFYTPSLKIINHLFNGCSSLKYLDISNFNTSLVSNLGYIFKECNSLLSIDISNFDTSSVTGMRNVFETCSSLESIDLSNFNTSLVKIMSSMFVNCISLKYLNLSNFNINNGTEILKMFDNCTSLETLDLSYFKANVESLEDLFGDLSKINIINRTTISKNELINNFEELFENLDLNNGNIIEGIDFSMIIKPINKYIERSTVNIDFSECEKKLKEKFPNTNFTLLQVNMKNNNKNCLIDQVEYKVYDSNRQQVDLSICKDSDIIIEYEIQDKNLINLDKIKFFKDMDVDIFNIKDSFFNDICYPYSDSNSSSDMILSDRISDIYQNYSICGNECKYQSFDYEKMTSNCSCNIKNEMNLEVEIGNFETSIESAFLDSNFGVIKCYNLVLNMKENLKNVGFWIFGIIIILHFPINIAYFLHGINPIKKYINNEMSSKGYGVNLKNKNKRNSVKSKTIRTTGENIKNTKENSNNPPKKKIRILKFIDSKKDLNTIVTDENFSSKNISETEQKENEKNNSKEINEEINNIETLAEKIEVRRKKEKNKTFKRAGHRNSNLITKSDINELIDYHKPNKFKRRNRKSVQRTSLTVTTNSKNIINNENQRTKKVIKNKKKINTEFPLILINANNIENHELLKSNYILDNYDYNEAIEYDNRSFCRIFFIYLIIKDNVLNIIFFNPPLELRPLRICIFMFNYSCDLALNALFYLSDNISDKYHYSGANRILFSLINNLTISISSTIVSMILLTFFESLIQSSNSIVKLFRDQEELLKSDKNYKVDEQTKSKISNDIAKILRCLKIKIIFFIIFEFLFTLFFFYYVTSFCSVYKSTQISWLLDTISSYVISFIITLAISLIFSILYKISIIYKIKILFSISMFIYS